MASVSDGDELHWQDSLHGGKVLLMSEELQGMRQLLN